MDKILSKFDLNSINFSTWYNQRGVENKTLFWNSTDNLENYNKNLNQRYSELEKYGWINSSFTYQFNKYGFRCEDFSHDPTIMFLGCSNTVGTGLPLEKTFPQIVAKNLKLKCANLGVEGTSPDHAFRMCLGYLDIVKPKIVVYSLSPGIRLEVITLSGPKNVPLAGVTLNDEYLVDFISDNSNEQLNTIKNVLAMNSLCKDRGIKFYYMNNFHEKRQNYQHDLARDLIHLGINHNLGVAEFLTNELENLT